MKITLNKFLVVTEDETEILAAHSPRNAYFRAWPDKDPSDSFYETIHGAKASITQYRTYAEKRVDYSDDWKTSTPRPVKVLKVIPITLTIET